MSASTLEPELYHLDQTLHVPNSHRPVLVYRDALPHPLNSETAQAFLEHNQWKKGGAWGPIPRHHFHPNTHECYAVTRGSSTLLLGVGPSEDPKVGQKVHLAAGDVIILPAGVSHCSVDFQDDYFYLGFYPLGSPKWKNEYCRDADRTESLRREADNVAIPAWDPVIGLHGPVYNVWTAANRSEA